MGHQPGPLCVMFVLYLSVDGHGLLICICIKRKSYKRLQKRSKTSDATMQCVTHGSQEFQDFLEDVEENETRNCRSNVNRRSSTTNSFISTPLCLVMTLVTLEEVSM